MKRCCRRFNLGDLLLKVNFAVLVVSAMYFMEYAINYMEFTKAFKIDCAWFFGSLILELALYCIKHSN